MTMFADDRELLAEFVAEASEHLAGVEGLLLELENQAEGADLEVVNTVFRAVHSVKGAAGFLGLTKVNDLAHRLEEVLNRVRGRRIAPTTSMIEALLGAIDRLQSLISAVDSSNDEDISDHLQALQQILDPAAVAPEAAALQPIAEAPATPVVSPPAAAPSTVSEEALHEFLIESHENLEQLERDLLALEQDPGSEAYLRSIFRTIHTIKGTAGFLGYGSMETLANAGENLLSSLRARRFELDKDLSNALLSLVDGLRNQLDCVGKQAEPPRFQGLVDRIEQIHHLKIASPAPDAETPPPKFRDRPAPDVLASPVDSTIRVDVALLDKLMTRVGELVLARNQIMQSAAAPGESSLPEAIQRLNLITTELQESVMKTRMQPIGNVWNRFPRLVRDLALACGKQIRLELTGRETELDKTILESIKDPLTHLVRNSIDHGLEAPSRRAERGKPPEGCIGLRAYHEGGQVVIEIRDDGAGLDLDRIRRKAVERGLVSGDQAGRMSDRESAQLIFLPGFSTADKVTSLSGRGVGMDVVKTNIERIGGAVDVQSREGHGTTIKIKIPLTLAIIPAVVVSCRGERYAIPQVNLRELVRLDGEPPHRGIEWLQGTPVYRLRGRLLPLVFLDTLLEGSAGNRADAPRRGPVNVVVLRADDRQFGLVVDGVNDTEEIVVKPLGPQLKGIPVFSGATIMGDGRVALILDALGLALAGGVGGESPDRPAPAAAPPEAIPVEPTQTLLLLGIGARRVALPVSAVARLEELPRSQFESADGRTVVQYRGAILPLVALSELLHAPGDQQVVGEADLAKVVVCRQGEVQVGLIVDRVLDIVETVVEARCAAAHDLLTGSAAIQHKVTDLLDVEAVVRRVVPRQAATWGSAREDRAR